MASEIKRIYEFGKFRFDVQTQCLKLDNELVQLSPKSLAVLAILIERRGDVVSREALIDAVWDDAFVEDGSLTVAVSALRKMFAELGGDQSLIQTVARKGYRFTADVEEQVELRSQPIVVARRSIEELTLTREDGQLSTAKRTMGLRALLAVAALVLVAIGGIFAFRPRVNKPVPLSARSLAVLPVRNLTGDSANDFLIDGVTESVITELAKIHGLKVIARNSSFALKGKTDDPKALGEQLRVTHLLDSSIRREGDLLRLETRLLNAATGEIVWSGTFERKMEEVLTVQDSIACHVSRELRATLCGERDSDPQKYTRNLKAYQAYLKGRFYWYQRGSDPLRNAVVEFEKALQYDPNYALAFAGLAETYLVMETNGVIPPGAGIPKAVENAEKAIRLDPALPGSYAALGMVRLIQRRPAEAEQLLTKAVEVNPNYATAWQWRSELYNSQGRFLEAEAGLKKAQELDPLSLAINYALGDTYYYMRDYDRVVAQADHIFSIFPEHFGAYQLQAMAFDSLGRHTEALVAAEKAHPANIEALRGRIFSHNGRQAETRQIIVKMERSETAGTNPYIIAQLYALLNENDKAFLWLERAFEIHQAAVGHLNIDQDFDSIRNDPRFAALVSRD